ncbi:hypothetical protein ABZU32_09150 [Sphaerisporangium sp. NPDC005288]|uniref:hypothetical protein n=1 Tax=Sphaerisporangium sp. NPDC005288 TaxID=3155114 RepID=UPI0033B0C401
MFLKKPEVVRALPEAGADPARDTPSAWETAQVFGHAEFLEWFARETKEPRTSGPIAV